MPLPPIPPDPKPTEGEINAILRQLPKEEWKLEWSLLPSDMEKARQRRRAMDEWERRRRAAEPDAFAVRFSTDPEAFGSQNAYSKYREGETWKVQRQRVLEAAGGKCQACDCKATEVHHRDYRPRVIAGEDDTPLVALCRECHDYIHAKLPFTVPGKPWITDAQKTPSWHDTESRLARLVARIERACTSRTR